MPLRRLAAADLPATLAVFPLTGALLLPRARLPLHVFEPRYLAMLEDCMKTPHRLIGMVQPRGGKDDGTPPLETVGCAGRLTSFAETEDGRYMITLTGLGRFRLRDEVAGFTPYRRCNVDWAPFSRDLGPAEDDPAFDRGDFLDLLGRYFTAMELTTDWSSLREAETEMLINTLSMLLPFPPEDKQALLEAPTLSTRRETLAAVLEFALHGGPAGERVQ